MFKKPLRVAAALTFVALIAAACSSGSATPSTTTVKSTGAASANSTSGGGSGTLAGSDTCKFNDYKYCYTETLQLTGAVQASGIDQAGEYSNTCQTWMADYANQNGGEVQLPQLILGTQGNTVELGGVTLEGWKGAGTYALQTSGSGTSSYVSLGGEGGVIANANATYTVIESPTSPQSVNVTVESDGSFNVAFQNLANSSNPSQLVSGEAQYTCKNA
jgi:hypothetical protein